MPVNRDVGSWFNSIKHPMTLVLQRLVEVIVHPKPRGGFGLLYYSIKEGFIYDCHLL